ncbi:NINE protein [Romboutsia sp.]|uniref:NINE protein n=1 Tax=Romboutsia sp. TaxID=1965302 RepID=UPI003F2C3188
MYCKECGENYLNENATFCIHCGVKKGNGNVYCDHCGTMRKSANQDVCLNCGKDLKKFFPNFTSEKTKLVLLLLWFFLGGFGAHHFYVGNNSRGILYLCLTLAGFLTFGITTFVVFIFVIIDLINILTDKFKDSNGDIISRWN